MDGNDTATAREYKTRPVYAAPGTKQWGKNGRRCCYDFPSMVCTQASEAVGRNQQDYLDKQGLKSFTAVSTYSM
jgi:hypothetical protein